MNLPNKITMSRIILSLIVIAILIFPFDAVGITSLKLFVNESIVIDIKYIVAGILFLVASLTDFLDGYVARKYNMVTDLGKMLDAIADKILVNSVLIILATSGFIHPIIPIVIIIRDIIVNSIKMVAGNKGNVVAASPLGKMKTIVLMIGIALTLFYNMPFELWNLKISEILLIIACAFAIVSGVDYYYKNRHLIVEEKATKKKAVS